MCSIFHWTITKKGSTEHFNLQNTSSMNNIPVGNKEKNDKYKRIYEALLHLNLQNTSSNNSVTISKKQKEWKIQIREITNFGKHNIPDKEYKELFVWQVGDQSGVFQQHLLLSDGSLQHHRPN